MDGVILYVDDHIDDARFEDGELRQSEENKIYESLRKEFPVLGVKNLEMASKAVSSVGAFSAIILDWVFDDAEELLLEGETIDEIRGVRTARRGGARTLEFLEKHDFYSLIFVYSNEDVEADHGPALIEKFGNRIMFEKKGRLVEEPARQIIDAIQKWRKDNSNLAIPVKWAAAINGSTQQIFKELAEADPDWVHEIYRSASDDGVNPELFVIEIFQSLLGENIVQAKELLRDIREYVKKRTGEPESVVNEESIDKLFRRLIYSPIREGAPLMTGDICEIDTNKYGVLISPECDMRRILTKDTNRFELLVFDSMDFDQHIAKTRAILTDGSTQNFKRTRFAEWSTGNDSQKDKLEELRKAFNQNEPRFHLLPSFPFGDKNKRSAVIEFSLGAEMYTVKEVCSFERKFKLNSPFVQQLRQRYLAYLGRVGTPGLPSSLRNWNLRA